MKFTTKVFAIGGLVLGVGSFASGMLDGSTVANTMGQVTGTLLGFAVVWFAFSRIEFQVNCYLERRVKRKQQEKSKGESE